MLDFLFVPQKLIVISVEDWNLRTAGVAKVKTTQVKIPLLQISNIVQESMRRGRPLRPPKNLAAMNPRWHRLLLNRTNLSDAN